MQFLILKSFFLSSPPPACVVLSSHSSAAAGGAGVGSRRGCWAALARPGHGSVARTVLPGCSAVGSGMGFGETAPVVGSSCGVVAGCGCSHVGFAASRQQACSSAARAAGRFPVVRLVCKVLLLGLLCSRSRQGWVGMRWRLSSALFRPVLGCGTLLQCTSGVKRSLSPASLCLQWLRFPYNLVAFVPQCCRILSPLRPWGQQQAAPRRVGRLHLSGQNREEAAVPRGAGRRAARSRQDRATGLIPAPPSWQEPGRGPSTSPGIRAKVKTTR